MNCSLWRSPNFPLIRQDYCIIFWLLSIYMKSLPARACSRRHKPEESVDKTKTFPKPQNGSGRLGVGVQDCIQKREDLKKVLILLLTSCAHPIVILYWSYTHPIVNLYLTYTKTAFYSLLSTCHILFHACPILLAQANSFLKRRDCTIEFPVPEFQVCWEQLQAGKESSKDSRNHTIQSPCIQAYKFAFHLLKITSLPRAHWRKVIKQQAVN